MIETAKYGASDILAVFFDLDGVTAESEVPIRRIETDILNEYEIPSTEELLAEFTGVRFAETAKVICERLGLGRPIEEIVRVHRQRVAEAYVNTIQLVDHISEVLQTLRRQNYFIGLTTSRQKLIAVPFLQQHGLRKYFHECSFVEDVRNRKPNPEGYLRTAERLGLNPRNCAVVEDSDPGLEAGDKAGMLKFARKAPHNVGVVNFDLADYVVEDLREIPPILSSINNSVQRPSRFGN